MRRPSRVLSHYHFYQKLSQYCVKSGWSILNLSITTQPRRDSEMSERRCRTFLNSLMLLFSTILVNVLHHLRGERSVLLLIVPVTCMYSMMDNSSTSLSEQAVILVIFLFTYLAEFHPDHSVDEVGVWALEFHSSFCYSLLLIPIAVQQAA